MGICALYVYSRVHNLVPAAERKISRKGKGGRTRGDDDDDDVRRRRRRKKKPRGVPSDRNTRAPPARELDRSKDACAIDFDHGSRCTAERISALLRNSLLSPLRGHVHIDETFFEVFENV